MGIRASGNGMMHSWIFALLLVIGLSSRVTAEDGKMQYVQLAELEIEPTELDRYTAAIKEHIETAIRVEPGVLALYAVSEKSDPTHIKVFEIYRDTDAYKAHLESAHFKKYKATTEKMVKSLKLVPTVALLLGAKGN